MLQLQSITSNKVWGYELWIASTHEDGCQADFLAATGGYPLLVKVIQADDTLSVQVHPDDAKAVELEGANARGKTECWYVLDAKPGAKLVYGLNGTYTREQLADAIEHNTLESCLQNVEVHKGDFIFIPAGTVHAIGGGLRLLEVQQSCNITYRLYDWGRPRELHVEKGLQSIKQEKTAPVAPMAKEFECAYFDLQRIQVKGGYSWLVPAAKEADAASGSAWQLVFIVSGTGSISTTMPDGTKSEPQTIAAENIFALAPGEKATVEGNAEIIRIKAK